jgi:hypothetical protein
MYVIVDFPVGTGVNSVFLLGTGTLVQPFDLKHGFTAAFQL